MSCVPSTGATCLKPNGHQGIIPNSTSQYQGENSDVSSTPNWTIIGVSSIRIDDRAHFAVIAVAWITSDSILCDTLSGFTPHPSGFSITSESHWVSGSGECIIATIPICISPTPHLLHRSAGLRRLPGAYERNQKEGGHLIDPILLRFPPCFQCGADVYDANNLRLRCGAGGIPRLKYDFSRHLPSALNIHRARNLFERPTVAMESIDPHFWPSGVPGCHHPLQKEYSLFASASAPRPASSRNSALRYVFARG